MRQIILDTETTGLETSQGHRVIEIVAILPDNVSVKIQLNDVYILLRGIGTHLNRFMTANHNAVGNLNDVLRCVSSIGFRTGWILA